MRDRVLQHALLREIGPVFERRFIEQSFSAGRGPQRAALYYLGCQRRQAWHLHLDIRAYFPSIPHQRLLELLGERVRDWLREQRGLQLNPKRLAVEPTRTPAVFVGYRISQSGITTSRKLRRRLRERLRTAAAKGEESLIRTVRSYRGLLVFP